MTNSCNPTPPSSGGGGAPPSCPTQPCPPVEVKIVLELPVGCPCHPLKATAVGTPSGGTYEWTVSGGGAQLVNSGGTADTVGPILFLRSFQPDNVAGRIPEQTATLSVTYTHPNGTASATETVKFHSIDFLVTNTTINKGVTQANETAGALRLGNAPGIPTMSTDPQVEIQLDASCPRKTDCAQGHLVGWLQTVLTNNRTTRYTHTEMTLNPNSIPIRDQINGPTPFYDGSSAFLSDRDKITAHHEDSPEQGASWTDTRTSPPAPPAPPPAKNQQLRSLSFSNGFHAWLVVQDSEWAVHDLNNSFVFLGNFAWSMELNVTVDTSKAILSRCTPASNPATIGTFSTGKGAVNPVLTESFPNRDHTVTENAAPEI